VSLRGKGSVRWPSEVFFSVYVALVDQQDVDAWPHFRTNPVCAQYWKQGVVWNGTVATSQTQSPGTDTYIATQKNALPYLTPATLLHESLHNLTGLGDDDLYKALTGKTRPPGPTVIINTVLLQNG